MPSELEIAAALVVARLSGKPMDRLLQIYARGERGPELNDFAYVLGALDVASYRLLGKPVGDEDVVAIKLEEAAKRAGGEG